MTTSSLSLAQRAYDPKTGTLDLGELYPALRRYCPILYGTPSIHEHPAQCLFLLLDCEEAFYGGAAGGGKSAALLAGALQYVDVPGYRALILRRTFQQLSKGDALIPLSHEWLAGSDARWNEQKHRWTFPSGATLEFGHAKDENAKYDYQGAAYHYVGFDELTQFTPTVYEYIAFSRQRRRVDMAELGVPVRVRAAANPGGIGHLWVKKRFVEPSSREPGAVFIPAKLRDNPGLDHDDYERRLRKLNVVLAQQLLDGDWGGFEGAAFHTFDPSPGACHVVPIFSPDDQWDRFECMDQGINAPNAWYAVATDYDGNLVVFDSVYEPALPSEIAPRILARRGYWRSSECYADPSIVRRTGGLTSWGAPATIATEFEENGIALRLGNNDPRAGYARLRELIEPDPKRRFPDWHPRAREFGSPRLFVVGQTCPELVEQLAAAPLQPIEKQWAGEMIDPDWESSYGHAVAAARYGVLSRPGPSVRREPPPEDPRARFLAEQEAKRDRQAGSRSRYRTV